MKKIFFLIAIAIVFLLYLFAPQFSRYKAWWSNEDEARFIQHCSLPPFESDIDIFVKTKF
tara:strand:- start:1901 stop:2080 length:180 start_codon:yes stop_codon:yes gene_type:complete